MKFFKPEDFNIASTASRELAADAANAKLEREGKVVYGSLPESETDYNTLWADINNKWKSHKALLINIELNEKCTHPSEKISTDTCLYSGKPYQSIKEPAIFRCACGARVTPNSFTEVT